MTVFDEKSLIGNDWDEILAEEFGKDYFRELNEFLKEEYGQATVYPPSDEIFNALRYTSFADAKVVILGQDPYHEPGQAHGLSFSVPKGILYPPSLRNIFKELDDDIGLAAPAGGARRSSEEFTAEKEEGVLTLWAKQGALLLNTVLTVRAHEAGSHRGKGWEIFTDAIIEKLAERKAPLVFILWGAAAGAKEELIRKAAAKSGTRHLIIKAPHPSPLSAHRGFFGGRYFSRANYFIRDNGGEPIDWHLH